MIKLFYSLTSPEQTDRFDAASKIISHLHGPDAQGSELKMEQDSKYTLNRLIRGLISKNENARLGFATCLVALLKQANANPENTIKRITWKNIYKVVKLNITVCGSPVDLAMLRLLAIQCWFLAFVAGQSPEIILDEYLLMTRLLKNVYNSKSYMRCAAVKCMCLLIAAAENHLDESDLKIIGTLFIESDGAIADSPEPVTNEAVQIVEDSENEKNFMTPEMAWFSVELYKSCINLNSLTTTQNIMGSPSVNESVYDIILNGHFRADVTHPLFLSLAINIKILEKETILLWNQLQMFAGSTNERKKIFMELGVLILEHNPDCIGWVLTTTYLRLLMSTAGNKSNTLNQIAVECCKKLAAFSSSKDEENHGQFIVQFVLKLVAGGYYKTKTIETMLSNMTPDSLNLYTSTLKNIFSAPTTEETEGGSLELKKWVIDQMALMIRSGKFKKNSELVRAILDFISNIGYANTSVTETSTYARTRLFEIVANLTSLVIVTQTTDGSEVRSIAGYMDGQITWLAYIASKVQEVSKKSCPNIESLLLKITELNVRVQIDSTDQAKLRSFLSMFNYLHLSLLNSADDSEVSAEIIKVYEKMFAIKATTPKKRKRESKEIKQEDVEQDEPKPIEVMVDILISFLSKPSTLLRHISIEFFKTFLGEVNEKCVDLIFGVLNSGNENDGEDDLFENESDSDVESDSSDGEDLEDDVKTVVNDEEQNQLLLARVQEAMNTKMDDPSDLSDLDDDQMMQFDDKLVEIFTHKKQAQVSKKQVENESIHFKVRVLDLIAVVLSHDLKVIDRILELYSNTSAKSLKSIHDRIVNIFKKTQSCTYTHAEMDFPGLGNTLKIVHQKCLRHSDPVFVSLSAFIVKQMCSIESGHEIELWDGMVSKQSELKPMLFLDIAKRYTKLSIILLPHLLQSASKVSPKIGFKEITILDIISKFVCKLTKDTENSTETLSEFLTILSTTLSRIGKNDGETPGKSAVTIDRIKRLLEITLSTKKHAKKLTNDQAVFVDIVESVGSIQRLDFNPNSVKQIRKVCGRILSGLDTKKVPEVTEDI